MKKRSLAFASIGFVLMAGCTLAADVTFAVKVSSNAPQAAFHYVKVSGGLPTTKVVKTATVVDGAEYFVWKTSLRGIAQVCGILSLPTAGSKCVGEFGKQLKISDNFVVLQ